ncbi:MAG: GNAT family N-acetyltransferase [Chitinivibrionales bacterium]|nr:GNAT family N-acetyltransferase [Chitinivibrionales bacterium]
MGKRADGIGLEDCRIVRLEPDTSIGEFDCDDDDLNAYLRDDAKNYLRELMATTYLVVGSKGVVAYFSVANDSIRAEDFPSNSQWNKFRRRLPHAKRYRSSPAVKIGRFGVAKQYQGTGIGRSLMEYIKYWFTHGNKTGCRYLVVDAYHNRRALGFYERCGFQYFGTVDEHATTRAMHYDLRPYIAAALEEQRAVEATLQDVAGTE